MSSVDTDVVVLRARPNWQLNEACKILVPVGGKGGQDELRARLLGSLSRTQVREVCFIRVMPEGTPKSEIRRAHEELERYADGEAPGFGRAEIVIGDDPVAEISKRAEESDLTIIGVHRVARRKKYFGKFALKVVSQTGKAVMLISRRG